MQPALDATLAKLFQQHPVLGIGKVRYVLGGVCKRCCGEAFGAG